MIFSFFRSSFFLGINWRAAKKKKYDKVKNYLVPEPNKNLGLVLEEYKYWNENIIPLNIQK